MYQAGEEDQALLREWTEFSIDKGEEVENSMLMRQLRQVIGTCSGWTVVQIDQSIKCRKVIRER